MGANDCDFRELAWTTLNKMPSGDKLYTSQREACVDVALRLFRLTLGENDQKDMRFAMRNAIAAVKGMCT